MTAQRNKLSGDLAGAIGPAPLPATLRDAAERAGAGLYIVGGAVRDALLGRELTNVDLVVDGDHEPVVEALGGEATVHDRFATATVRLGGRDIDVARARSETYPQPGALPVVEPAALAEDLSRRDFTINAMAVGFDAPNEVIDPLGGLEDLHAGLLRVLHDDSFTDDPTRALRAARYAARLGFEVEPHTLALLRATDLGTVSRDRVAAELGKLAAEPNARAGFELLAGWGLLELPPGAGELIDAIDAVLGQPQWADVAARPAAILAAVRGVPGAAHELADAHPGSASAAVALARGRPGVELVLGRALGAKWLDDYVGRWRDVALEISGEDLIAAGVAEGPAVGRGLAAALRAKLDGEAADREAELRIALDAARD